MTPRTIHMDRDPLQPETANKYKARPATRLGPIGESIRFASEAEARRYDDLRLRELAGEIVNLMVHPRYHIAVNGVHVTTYVADFRYRDLTAGVVAVEDVKSRPTRTPAYAIKVKLMAACYGIHVREVLT